MGQQCPGRDLRRRDGLCQLREVAAQGQRLQIRPQAVEQLRRGSFIGVVPLALLIEGPLRIDQLLGAGGVLQLFRRTPRAMTEILPRSAVSSVRILSASFVSVSRRTTPFVTM